MNVHGVCGKAGSDLCRIFHAESLSINPHNEEKKQTGKISIKKSSWAEGNSSNSDLHSFGHASNCQNQLIGILTLTRNLDKNSAAPEIAVLDLLH